MYIEENELNRTRNLTIKIASLRASDRTGHDVNVIYKGTHVPGIKVREGVT